MFHGMLKHVLSMSVNDETMGKLKTVYEQRDYVELKNLVHILKGSSGYVGAGRLHYACYYIQESFILGKYDRMLELYPSLIEAVIEFKTSATSVLAKNGIS